MSEDDIENTVDRWLDRIIMLKYLGFLLLGLNIAAVVIFSLLRVFDLMPLVHTGIIISILVIIIGIVGERILTA